MLSISNYHTNFILRLEAPIQLHCTRMKFLKIKLKSG